MTKRAHGQLRRGQLITTFGPGAMIDLPRYSAIVGGLDSCWPRVSDLEEIVEPRLSQKLQSMTSVRSPRLLAPPPVSSDPSKPSRGVEVWRFPEWFVVQEESGEAERGRSRRLVHRRSLDEKGRFDGRLVVATRFVRSCPKGHVDDLDWYYFVHGPKSKCRRQLWLDERGTSGDLSDLSVRCECGKQRSMHEASMIELVPLGVCSGARPWLGWNAKEECKQPSRLLIRTASNAYFPQVVSALSLPDRGSAVGNVVKELWEDLQIVHELSDLKFLKKKPKVSEKLEGFADDEVLKTIKELKGGSATERPVKQLELEAILAAPEGFGEDVPVDPDFHVRRVPERMWRRTNSFSGVEAAYQLHRLREVLALIGFSRYEAVMPDINGEYETDVERASLALEPSWFPAVENRGEGIFLQLRDSSIREWLGKANVVERIDALKKGHDIWEEERKHKRLFPGGPYILLHTLSHMLIQSLSMRCGYPSSSIRERVYVDPEAGRYGILLFTGSPDADGTLGGLVQEARYIEDHLSQVMSMASLCSNDPICAQHAPGKSMDGRLLHGAACHGCALVAETSCEMHNEYLDRALLVPVLGSQGSAFFSMGTK